MYFSSFEAGNCVSNFQLQMTKNRTPTPVHLDPGMHPGLEVKGLTASGKAVHISLHDSLTRIHPQSAGLDSLGSISVDWAQQWPAWYAALFAFSTRTASVGGIFSMFRDPWLERIYVALFSFNTSHVLLYINITNRSKHSESVYDCLERWRNTSVSSGKHSRFSTSSSKCWGGITPSEAMEH